MKWVTYFIGESLAPKTLNFTSSVAYKYHQDGFLAQGLGKEQQLQVRTGADYDDRQG